MTQRSSVWYGLASIVLVLGFLTFAGIQVVRGLTPVPDVPSTTGLPSDLNLPGRARPAAQTVGRAQLGDDEPVVGVEVAGNARAYALAALGQPMNHVVNDVIGDRPVTVTYCDLRDCVRVFSGDGTKPLDVRAGGYDRGLLLVADGARYHQESGAAVGADDPKSPYRPVEFVRTTWKEWRAAHPHTDVVTDPSARSVVGN